MIRAIFLAACALALSGGPARAAEADLDYIPKWYVGALGGGAFPHKSGADSRVAFGGRLGRRLFDRLDTGLLILRSTKRDKTFTTEFADTFLVLACDYAFESFAGLRAGPRFGQVIRSAKKVPGTGADLDVMKISGGFGAGYDYPLTRRLWLGAGVDWLYAPSGEKSVMSGGTKVTASFASYSVTHLTAGLTVRF